MEKPGVKLEAILTTTNPWKDQPCGRRDCNVCKQGVEGDPECKTRSVVYSNTCNICTQKGVKTQYIGETGRSGKERQNNHLTDQRAKNSGEIGHMELHRI